jgi:hypothetical protein
MADTAIDVGISPLLEWRSVNALRRRKCRFPCLRLPVALGYPRVWGRLLKCLFWESWRSALRWAAARRVRQIFTPAYVSPVAYQTYTCQQLALEAQSISTRAAALSGAQDSQRTKDGLATAAAVVVFWPAAFFVGGGKQTAAELSQMKGQMVAVEQASIAKKCNIQFQGERPPGT